MLLIIIESLYSPLNQLYAFLVILIALALIRWFYAPLIITGGVISIIFWMIAASIAGISTSVDWYYFLKLIAALIAGYFFLWLFAWLSEKWGRSYNSEGFILIIAPLTLSIFIIIPTILIKFVRQFIS
jgi:hypothetical protein